MLRLAAGVQRAIAAAAKVRSMCTEPTEPPMTLERLALMVGSVDTKLQAGLQSVDTKLENLDSRLGAVDRSVDNLNKRLGSVERKLGHSLEYQVRLEVAREYGREYAEQATVDCLINLVAHIPRNLLPVDPLVSPDHHSKILFMSRKISEELIRSNTPTKFMVALMQHLGVEESTVFLPDGSVDFHPIRRHPLCQGNWTALAQLETFFQLHARRTRREQATFMATCKGPGLLLLIFTACPHAIMHGKNLSLYSVLEFDFRGRMNLFVKEARVTGTIDIGEGKSSLDKSIVQQLGLRLDVVKLLLEKYVQVRHRVLKQKGKAVLQVTKVGRMFVPKAIVTQVQVDEQGDAMKEEALKRGFSFHLHRL